MSLSNLSPNTNRGCVICGIQADVFDSTHRITLCSVHGRDIESGRPFTLDEDVIAEREAMEEDF